MTKPAGMTKPAATTVINRRTEPEDVYIGRGSPFGNPYSHTRSSFNTIVVSSRDVAIQLYELWLTTDQVISGWTKPTPEQIKALRGKRLGCYCRPLSCHGDVLARLADDLQYQGSE